jgi:hypothetical protein
MPPHRRRPPSPRRLQLLLALVSTLLGVLVAEALYRVKLGAEPAAPAAASFTALSEPLTVFDREFGYTYNPGRTVVSCRIQDGRVTSYREVRIDAAGNLATDLPPPTDSLDVLVVGDSFTANPNQPLGWPHYYALQTGHRVHNYARDGYGLLQMIHLAAAKSRELKPDLVIVAIIVEDVTRSRTWRSTVNVDGYPTAVVAADPDRLDDPRYAMETALIDPEVTAAWCQGQMTNPDVNDAILVRLTERFRKLASRRHRAFLTTFTHSLLLNRIQHHDPYHGLRTPSLVPQADLTTFESDADFVRDIQSIQPPLHIVVLPKHDELVSRTLLGSKVMVGLLQSVKRITGKAPTFLLKPVLAENPDVDRMFLLPGDAHPSGYGGEVYGRVVGNVISGNSLE